MSELSELVRFYKALADETRLGLVQLLARQNPGRALCVGRLAEELGVTSSSISQHLRILKDLGLVRGERQSYRIHYWLDERRLTEYQELAREQLGSAFILRLDGSDQEEGIMCGRNDCGCSQPEKCQGHPGACSPEQIKECHGDVVEHPCELAEEAQSE